MKSKTKRSTRTLRILTPEKLSLIFSERPPARRPIPTTPPSQELSLHHVLLQPLLPLPHNDIIHSARSPLRKRQRIHEREKSFHNKLTQRLLTLELQQRMPIINRMHKLQRINYHDPRKRNQRQEHFAELSKEKLQRREIRTAAQTTLRTALLPTTMGMISDSKDDYDDTSAHTHNATSNDIPQELDEAFRTQNDTEKATWVIPTHTYQLPHPTSFDTGNRCSERRPERHYPYAPSPIDAHAAALEMERRTYPPIYIPLTIRGASGEAIKCMGLLDTGSEESYLNADLCARLKNTTTTFEDKRYGQATETADTFPLVLTDKPVRVWMGDTATELHFGVLAMSRIEVPHLLLGRRFMDAMEINLTNIPYKHPIPDEQMSDKEHVEINDRESDRLTDSRTLSPSDTARREALRTHIEDLLRIHTHTVPVDSFIKHPDATVHILHDEGTLPSYISQRSKPARSVLDQYITDQVELWLKNGKLIKWDAAQHGAWPRYNMPQW